MRPRGAFSIAVRDALLEYADERGATWRELAALTGIGYDTTRRTMENLFRAGQLRVLGTQPTECAGRPLLRYGLTPASARSAKAR